MQSHVTYSQEQVQEIPYGYCRCGCGQKTKLAARTYPYIGAKKGEPLFYIQGHHLYGTSENNFWPFVDKDGPNGCWIWTGFANKEGYGVLSIRAKRVLSHRHSYELRYGVFPDAIGVLHRCDNPACVNPDHLFLGTQTDNMKDMRQKGRGGARERKLSDEQALEIIRRAKSGESQCSLATEYGVDRSLISHLVHGRVRNYLCA